MGNQGKGSRLMKKMLCLLRLGVADSDPTKKAKKKTRRKGGFSFLSGQGKSLECIRDIIRALCALLTHIASLCCKFALWAPPHICYANRQTLPATAASPLMTVIKRPCFNLTKKQKEKSIWNNWCTFRDSNPGPTD